MDWYILKNVLIDIVKRSLTSKFEASFSSYEKKLTDNSKKTKKPIILITNNNPSSKVEKFLESYGFQEVYALDGGVNAWVEAGLPLKKWN